MKQCKRCLQEKELSDFYIHNEMHDKHLNFCKECTKARVSGFWYTHREEMHERERLRFQERKKNKGEMIKRQEYNDIWRKKDNGLRGNAHSLARKLSKNKPLNCSICGAEKKLHRHHEDYTKPLDVIWCCVSCHRQIHLKKEKV